MIGGFGRLGPWLARRDPREICRRLHLEGWEHLVAVDEEGPTDLLLAVSPAGPWPVALWAVAYYRGPLDVVLHDDRLHDGPDAAELRGLERIGVRRVDALPSSGRRARVGAEPGDATLHLVTSGNRRGFRVAITPIAAGQGPAAVASSASR